MTTAPKEKATVGIEGIQDRLDAITAQEKADALACFRRSAFILAEGGELNPAQTVALHAALKTLSYPASRIHEAVKAITEARDLQARIDAPHDLPALRRDVDSTRQALYDELATELSTFATTAPDLEALRLFIIRIAANCQWKFGSVATCFGLERTAVATTATNALRHAGDDPYLAGQELRILIRNNPDLWDRQ